MVTPSDVVYDEVLSGETFTAGGVASFHTAWTVMLPAWIHAVLFPLMLQ